MTTLENQSHDPDLAGALRGALTIVVIGAALGIGYNAMGLTSRPHRGLAWIKQPEKLESLEALQTAPGAGASTGSENASPAAAATSAASPGDAQAATSTTPAPEPAKSTPAGEAKHDSSATAAHHDTSGAAAHVHASKAKKGATASGSKAGATTTKKGTTPSGSQAGANGAKATTPAAAGAAAANPAAGAETGAAPPAAAAGGAATTAAADLPVIPDVAGPLKLEIATLKKLYAANAALIIDAREAEEYTDGHIKGATSLPYNDAMADPDKVKKLDPAGRPIVVYCSGGDCELSMNLAKLMVENGKRKVLVYEGGFPEWEGAGMPVTKGANP